MVKRKETPVLPGIPKADKCAEVAINLLSLRETLRELQDQVKDVADALAAALLAIGRASITVNYGDRQWTLEIDHIDASEKITIKSFKPKSKIDEI